MKKTLIGVTLVTIFAVACTKSGSSTSSADIIGKWNLVSERVKVYLSGIPLGDQTQIQKPGQYFDFRDNGSVYIKSYDSASNTYMYDTGSYKYGGDSLTLISTDMNYTMKVQTLNSSTLTLYTAIDSVSLGFPIKTELWINMNK